MDNNILLNSELIFSKLLFLSAKLGDFNLDKLKSVAVGVELLNLAVEHHYSENRSNFNQALILGDYFYAQAITLGAETEDNRIVKAMVEAVADISEAKASKDNRDENWLRKLASLYGTACYLGGVLSNVSSEILEALKCFGENVGCAQLVKKRYVEKDFFQNCDFLALAKEALKAIPQNEVRTDLESLLSVDI